MWPYKHQTWPSDNVDNATMLFSNLSTLQIFNLKNTQNEKYFILNIYIYRHYTTNITIYTPDIELPNHSKGGLRQIL